MKTPVMAVTLLAVCTAMSTQVNAENAREVQCGGIRLTYGTSIGSVGAVGRPQYASGIMAMAAVTTDDLRARAWIVWDERARAWLALARKSPSDLQRLWIFDKKPDFSGPGIQVRWTYLKSALPKRYQLTDCFDARP
jgi:hypothetical protein